MKTYPKIGLLLSAVLLAMPVLTACGGTEGQGDDTSISDTSTSAENTTAQEVVGYDYAGKDLGGKNFTILNCEKDKWGMICVIQPDEQNGELLNDAIYKRNEYVKEKLNFEITEVNESVYELHNFLEKSVLAQEEDYDIAYIPACYTIGGITEGYYQCLNDLENLNLDADYWDQMILEATSLGGKNYFASSSLHLMGMDGVWCLFFNENMCEDLDLDKPYDLVREGKWTLDKLAEYSRAAANLNGADSFTLTADSPAVYGTTSFNNSVAKFIYGMGGEYVIKDDKDLPIYHADSEKFVNILQKLAGFFGEEGTFVKGSDQNVATNYITIFMNGRTLFCGGELKAAQQLRSWDNTFGIVPFPKYDEAQENYQSTLLHQLVCATIPITNKAPEDAALILDALSYESDEQVLDIYYGVTVEQKGLRNEDSIEMLEIIKNSRGFDISQAYQWTSKLETELRNILFAGGTEVAGVIESYKTAVETSISDTVNGITK